MDIYDCGKAYIFGQGQSLDSGLGSATILSRIGRNVLIFVLVVMIYGVILVSAASGQPDRPLLRKEIRDRVNTIMIAKMDVYLDLSIEQADQFFPRFRQYNTRREDWEEQRRDAIDELVRVEESESAEENKVEDILSRLDKIDADLLALNRDFRNEVRPILTPKQRARLVIFSHRFPEHVREVIEEIRRQRMEEERHGGPPPRGRAVFRGQ